MQERKVVEMDFNEYDDLLSELYNFRIKEEKYRWHDLRKDPNDLPEGKDYYSSFVIVATESCTDFCTIARMDFPMNEWIEIGTGDDIVGECGKVIAWRYIEPFNNDEKSVSTKESEE